MKTCNVTLRVAVGTGPAPVVYARLSHPDLDYATGERVFPAAVLAQMTPGPGYADYVLPLWPNARGVAQSRYVVTIEEPNGRRQQLRATVPDVDTVSLAAIAPMPVGGRASRQALGAIVVGSGETPAPGAGLVIHAVTPYLDSAWWGVNSIDPDYDVEPSDEALSGYYKNVQQPVATTLNGTYYQAEVFGVYLVVADTSLNAAENAALSWTLDWPGYALSGTPVDAQLYTESYDSFMPWLTRGFPDVGQADFEVSPGAQALAVDLSLRGVSSPDVQAISGGPYTAWLRSNAGHAVEVVITLDIVH